MNKRVEKIISVMLIMLLTGINLITLGNGVIATSTNFSVQNGQTEQNNITIEEVSKEENSNETTLQENSEETTDNSIKNSEIITNTNMENVEKVSKAQISIEGGKENLSTIVENKNVEIRVVLDTSSPQNALYKNPILEIEFPEAVEKIEIQNVKLLLEEELKIKEVNLQEINGKKVIKIALEGTQTKYITQSTKTDNIIAKGANIILNTNITLNKLTPSKKEQIKLYYTNEATNKYALEETGEEKQSQNEEAQNQNEEAQKQNEDEDNEQEIAQNEIKAMQTKQLLASTEDVQEKGIATAELNIVAPSGIVALNKIKGYNEENQELMNMQDEIKTANIEAYAKKRTGSIEGSIINNYENSIGKVSILGRIPFEGNAKIDTNQSLNSTFTMPMKSKIQISGIEQSKAKIYYSGNGQATKDLNESSNGWTLEPENLENIKSYLIVLEEEVPKATQINFSYEVEIPENLSHSQSAYQMYKVYYTNKSKTAEMNETKISPILGVSTGEGVNLQVELSSTNKEKVKEGQIVKFRVKVTNTSKETAEDVTANVEVPDGTTYVKYNSGDQTYEDIEGEKQLIALGKLEPNESKTAFYELRMEEGTLGQIENKVIVAVKGIPNGVSSNTYTLEVEQGKIVLTNIVPRDLETALHTGDILNNTILIENITNENLENIVVTVQIPEGVKINKAYYLNAQGETLKENIKIEKQKVELALKGLPAGETSAIKLELQIENIKGELSYMAEATVNGEGTYYSNELVYYVGFPKIEMVQTAKGERYIKEAEEIVYEFTVINNGDTEAKDIIFENSMPNGLTFQKVEYTYEGNTQVATSTLNNTAVVRLKTFAKGTKLTIKVTAVADVLPEGVQEKEIVNVASITVAGGEKVESNKVTNIIEYNPNLYSGNEGNQGQTRPNATGSGYKITGTAWLDENQDGKRDGSEEVLAGIKVMLYTKETNQIVQDIQGNNLITTTDKNGKYEFNNLKNDEYFVIFLYDASKYNVTEYQKQDVALSENSDVISMKITLDGVQTIAGVTDAVKISNGNARDIDIGLYVAEKFDLKLDKYISKITRTTPTSGTSVFNYSNSKLTKVEILGKNVNKSSIIVEYKIVVTNEGQIPGYVKKIVDYMPEGAKFSSELNQDWYESETNGNLYNTSLENEKINPGESKEVSLILSIAITDRNITSVVNNYAEIYESYNEQGLPDMDSKEANHLETEDDMSKADILLSIVTGKIVLYTTLIIIVLMVIVVGIIIIKKKVLDKPVQTW